jgi:hypothetical protein
MVILPAFSPVDFSSPGEFRNATASHTITLSDSMTAPRKLPTFYLFSQILGLRLVCNTAEITMIFFISSKV